jgi:hypothetical protein
MMNTHKRSDRHKAKRERREKRRLARHVQSQLRDDLPKLSITWDEGVAMTVQEQARRILNNYYNRKLIQFYKMYHYAMENGSRALLGCHDADAAFIAVEQIRMAIVPPLAESCLKAGYHHPCEQGVYSWITPEARNINIRLSSLYGRTINRIRTYTPRIAQDLAYTKHFLDRWRERAVGGTQDARAYIGWWDLLGAIHAPGLRMSVRDAEDPRVRCRLMRVEVMHLHRLINIGYAACEAVPFGESSLNEVLVFKTFLTDAMVTAPWTDSRTVPESLFASWRHASLESSEAHRLLSEMLTQ